MNIENYQHLSTDKIKKFFYSVKNKKPAPFLMQVIKSEDCNNPVDSSLNHPLHYV